MGTPAAPGRFRAAALIVFAQPRRVGKIARDERRHGRVLDCDFAHVLGGGERARVGTAREIFPPARG